MSGTRLYLPSRAFIGLRVSALKKKKKKESVHCVKLQIHLTGRCSLLLVPMRPGNLQDVELEPDSGSGRQRKSRGFILLVQSYNYLFMP